MLNLLKTLGYLARNFPVSGLLSRLNIDKVHLVPVARKWFTACFIEISHRYDRIARYHLEVVAN